MSVDGDALQIVLYVDVPLQGEPYRHEHYVVTISAHQMDIADAMGAAQVLLFPNANGVSRAAALAPYLERTVDKLKAFPTDHDCVELRSRLRELLRACDRTPYAYVMARPISRK